MVTSTIILAAGSMFILWLGERITDKGIGNGISFIILIGIIARFPDALLQEVVSLSLIHISIAEAFSLVKYCTDVIG